MVFLLCTTSAVFGALKTALVVQCSLWCFKDDETRELLSPVKPFGLLNRVKFLTSVLVPRPPLSSFEFKISFVKSGVAAGRNMTKNFKGLITTVNATAFSILFYSGKRRGFVEDQKRTENGRF